VKNTHQPKVLIVDDDDVLCNLLSSQLEEDGYITTYTLNGPEALRKIKNENFNLVILNQNMPGMNGDEVLANLKANKSSVPVIMLSAQSDPAIIVKCIKLGAEDYQTKPWEHDELLDSIKKYIR